MNVLNKSMPKFGASIRPYTNLDEAETAAKNADGPNCTLHEVAPGDWASVIEGNPKDDSVKKYGGSSMENAIDHYQKCQR